MPALLKATSRRPYVDSAKATIASASFAFDTSAANARPPISRAVASAASPFTSTQTTFAPSRANSRADAWPMPLPAPVIRATFPLSLMPSPNQQGARCAPLPMPVPASGRGAQRAPSCHLEVAPPLPVRHGRVEFPLLGAEEVEIVIDHLLAERLPRPGALGERADRLAQRVRHLRQLRRRVDVAVERGRRLDVVLDAVESRGERRGEGEIDVRVRARRAALDAQRRSVADDAEAGGAVVVRPGDAGRREGAGHVALVRRRVRREEREGLADVLHPSAEEPAERLGVVVAEQRLLAALIP